MKELVNKEYVRSSNHGKYEIKHFLGEFLILIFIWKPQPLFYSFNIFIWLPESTGSFYVKSYYFFLLNRCNLAIIEFDLLATAHFILSYNFIFQTFMMLSCEIPSRKYFHDIYG
jgi:hypothetical protein